MVVGAVVLFLLLGYFAGKSWATRQIEGRIIQRLSERGLSIQWEDLTWTPWRGLLKSTWSTSET